MYRVPVCVVLLLVGIAQGQAQHNTPQESDRVTADKRSDNQLLPDQNEVWQGELDYQRYLQAKDLEHFMSLWDENFVGWPDYMERPIRKPEMRSIVAEELQKSQAPAPPLPAPTPEAIGIFGAVAVTHYFSPEADRSSPVQYRVMHAWQKSANGWHIVAGMDCEVPRSGGPNPAVASSNPSPASVTAVSTESPQEKSAVEATVRNYEEAIEQYDFAKADSLLAPNAKWIERSLPEPAAYDGTGFFAEAKALKVHLTNEPHDFDTRIEGDVAWTTLSVDVTVEADNEAARALLARSELEETGKTSDPAQRKWRATYVESEVLVKTPKGWRITLAHTSRLPQKAN